MFKFITYTLFLSLLVSMGCTPLDKKEPKIGPNLLEVTFKNEPEKAPTAYSAYIFLIQTREEIQEMKFKEELRRLGTPEEVKLRRRANELKQTFNNAVKSYRQMKQDEEAIQEFEKYRSLVEQQKAYIIKNYGV